jgi:hypothetical protein
MLVLAMWFGSKVRTLSLCWTRLARHIRSMRPIPSRDPIRDTTSFNNDPADRRAHTRADMGLSRELWTWSKLSWVVLDTSTIVPLGVRIIQRRKCINVDGFGVEFNHYNRTKGWASIVCHCCSRVVDIRSSLQIGRSRVSKYQWKQWKNTRLFSRAPHLGWRGWLHP